MKWLNSFCVKSKVKMETLKKLRRLAEPGDWCFSFDLQDGNHADGIDPDFQKYMQFDLQGQLFQFSALPFGSSDAPRVFVKFMKVMVEALRSPGAAEDRRELLKLKNGRVATPRYEVRRRAGGVHRDLRRRGARVLPYMDDFLILALTKEETYVQREHVRQVLARLGLCRNEKKGQWEPGQLIEHLGLEVYLRDGLPRSGVVAPAAGDEPVEWSENLEKSDEGEAPHGQFFAVWGGVLNLDKEARGFWPDELRHLHITLLELEAVFKTMQSFMRELEGKVVRLYCDNQAVVAMLSHFTSRNPELMRRMRRLWLLLDLHDIELQAQYIRSEANEWADRLSRCEDIDDWRLNRPRFVGADSAWGPHTVDRFASEILAQLPRYFAWWHDPRCEGVDSLAYDWRGEINWVNPPWALLDEEGPLRPEPPEAVNDSSCAEVQQPTGAAAEPVPVGTRLQIHWELDDAWYPGAVVLFNEDGFVNIVYDDGDEEVVDLANERYKNIGDVETPIEHSELAVQMQQAALQPTTKGNYDPKPYLSAINNYHEDLQYEAPAKGRSVIRAVKGMAVLQANQQVISDEVLTERTYLPAQHVWAAQQAATAMTPKTLEELRLLRACVYTVFAYVTFGRPDTVVKQAGELRARAARGMVSRRALELLLESLLAFCSHVVWGLSIHTRRGLNFLVATTGRRMVRLPHQVQEDLTVLEQVVRQYNAKRVVLERRLVDERHFATDASGTLGFGGVWERLFFILSWADLARLPQRPWFPESGVPFQLEHQLPGALCGLVGGGAVGSPDERAHGGGEL
ncbi:hypothetical protein CYMTET_24560 [Cymbomonas tetramitiformis]|uniref:Reverse transcriptase domain-containing protein n=1 Tax=Cymbomonas tetramitiformis TaxID=36881 RepID=A0AAE0L055_9CHLO|nr:hypothetical protein CYMTET_24560 [Cymbomonas tetramitiformis]